MKEFKEEVDEDNAKKATSPSEYNPEEQVLKALNQGESEDETEEVDFDEAYRDVLKSEPDDILRAYHEVYGCWPDGWPVRKDDYL